MRARSLFKFTRVFDRGGVRRLTAFQVFVFAALSSSLHFLAVAGVDDIKTLSSGALLSRVIAAGDALETSFMDLLFAARPARPAPPDVAVVLLDHRSFTDLHVPAVRTFPREHHAAAVERLSRAGAGAVVLDFVFAGPGPDPAGDDRLAAALAAHTTVIAAVYRPARPGRPDQSLLPEPRFRRAATAVGDVAVPFSPGDRIARRFPAAPFPEPGIVTRSIAAEAALLAGVRDEVAAENVYLDYYEPLPSGRLFATHSLSSVLAMSEAEAARHFRGKTVFVGNGLDVVGSKLGEGIDSFRTPHGSVVYGVEVQATAYANLVHGDALRRVSFRAEVFGGMTFVGVVTAAALALPGQAGPAAAATLLGLLLYTAHVAFGAGTFVPAARPLLLGGGSALLGVLYHYANERMARTRITGMFSHYLDPRMVDRLVAGEHSLDLGGELLPCALMFTDVQGFTALSENRSPTEIAAVMNDYFSRVSTAVTDRDGTVVKFIGDGMFSLWGAPLPSPDMADRALDAALAVIAADTSLPDGTPVRTRVGLHVSDVVVGHLGSSSRFDYTALGDGVNLAARLEGLNKEYGTRLLVSDAFKRSLLRPGPLEFLYLGRARAAGKTKAVMIYTLPAALPAPLTFAQRVEWGEAVALFEEGRFRAASEAFYRIEETVPALEIAARCYLGYIELLPLGSLDEGEPGSIEFRKK